LVKSVTRQVVSGRPSHVVGQPWSSASTDLLLRIALYHLIENVTMKPTHDRCKVGPVGQGVWSAGHLLGPLVSGLCTQPPRVRYSLG
jgi:hypothetical protein